MKSKYKLNLLILILVSFIVLYFVLKDDFNTIIDIISSVNIYWLILAVVLAILSWFFSALSLYALASNYRSELTFKEILTSFLATLFFNGITPFSSGGQPFQIYDLKQKGVNLSAATNIVIQYSTLYQVVLVIFGFVALLLNNIFDYFPSNSLLKKLTVIGFIINVCVILFLLYINIGKKSHNRIMQFFSTILNKLKIIKNKAAFLEKIEKKLDNFHESASYFGKNKKVLFKAIIFNIISFILIFSIPLILAFSFGNYTDLNFIQTLVVSSYILIIGSFVPIPGGTGGLEFAFVQFFVFFIKGPILLAMLLLWRLITYYLGMIIGAFALMLGKERKREEK
ncbi:MAG: lysylphosphatidylglycerol synthase transmembrane domain-containing protein [Bacilli bacterium]|nr:lysylphosphatidylglycerol synthase transmembrane domain-containing protein [Bacilli bacterium]